MPLNFGALFTSGFHDFRYSKHELMFTVSLLCCVYSFGWIEQILGFVSIPRAVTIIIPSRCKDNARGIRWVSHRGMNVWVIDVCLLSMEDERSWAAPGRLQCLLKTFETHCFEKEINSNVNRLNQQRTIPRKFAFTSRQQALPPGQPGKIR